MIPLTASSLPEVSRTVPVPGYDRGPVTPKQHPSQHRVERDAGQEACGMNERGDGGGRHVPAEWKG